MVLMTEPIIVNGKYEGETANVCAFNVTAALRLEVKAGKKRTAMILTPDQARSLATHLLTLANKAEE